MKNVYQPNPLKSMEEFHENHAVSKIGLHLVWCTKFRHPVLKNGVEIVVKNVLAQTCLAYGWKCRSLEIMPDHVHVLVQIHHTDSPVHVVQTLKSMTAIVVFREFPRLKKQKFWGTGLWSNGSYYGSVGDMSLEIVQKYIAGQKKKEKLT